MNTKNVVQYSCIVSFQVFSLFCINRLTRRGSNFGFAPEKSSDRALISKITTLFYLLFVP
jgi:hypothetical protein